jgi:hypothetical protein
MQFPEPSSGISEMEQLEQSLRGRELKLVCSVLRAGKEEVVTVTVATGQDVAYAKAQLARKLDLDYGQIAIYLKDKLMIDPLSFADFPEITSQPGTEVHVSVRIT